MKIWLLRRTERIQYDENISFVIRAETADAARVLAWEKAAYAPHEDPNCWIDPTRSSCKDLTLGSASEILSTSFYHA